MSDKPPQTIYLYHGRYPFDEQDGVAWGAEPIPPFVDVDDDIVATKYVRSDGNGPAGGNDRLRDALKAVYETLLFKPVGARATSEAIRIARDALRKP